MKINRNELLILLDALDEYIENYKKREWDTSKEEELYDKLDKIYMKLKKKELENEIHK